MCENWIPIRLRGVNCGGGLGVKAVGPTHQENGDPGRSESRNGAAMTLHGGVSRRTLPGSSFSSHRVEEERREQVPSLPPSLRSLMSIQGQLLDVTVVGCSKLKDTEWISRQDPYVCLEYATTKFRTRTCTDGGKHPTFQEKTVVPLIEGLREISVAVWNSNTITFDDFIGSGRIQLHKVLSQGYDDSSWALQTKSGKFAGEVKLIMHFAGAHQQQQQQQQQQVHGHQQYKPHESNYPASTPPPYMPMAPPAPSSYAPPPLYPSTMHQYSALGSAYPATYPPAPYPSSTYPPSQYPPTTYPPQPYHSAPTNPHHAPGPYSGIYPPPPY